MTKVPQRDEIWKHKKDGYLARITNVTEVGFIEFLDNHDGCDDIQGMVNGTHMKYFKRNFVFVGNGKPLNILFEVQDER